MSDHFSELKKLEFRDEKNGYGLKMRCVLRRYFAPKVNKIHSSARLGVISTIYNHYAPLNDYAPLVTDMISAGRPKKILRISFAFSMDFY